MFGLLQTPDLHWHGLSLLAPELTLVVTSLVVLVMDLVWKERPSSGRTHSPHALKVSRLPPAGVCGAPNRL